jgi:hypothetical protein
MRTHLGCTGSVGLGELNQGTQQRLAKIEASWLEYSPEPPALVVRHVQPDNVPALGEIAGELLEFLSIISDAERVKIPGGALYCTDEQTGQYVRIKVWKGGFLTVAWASPNYQHAHWEPFRGQSVTVVFEAYQRLNGTVRLEADPVAAEQIREVIEQTAGLATAGNYEISSSVNGIVLSLSDTNASVLPLLRVLRGAARPGSLDGEIDVSSFRPGDLEDYCRFAMRNGEVWLVRPSLWSEIPEAVSPSSQPLGRVA